MLEAVFADTKFWVMLSTVFCFGFIAWKAYRPIFGALDARAAQVRNRLQEAEDLRDEAFRVLQEYKTKNEHALDEATAVLKNAEARADQMRQGLEHELAEILKRQEAGTKARLQRLEQETIEAVKAAVIAAAIDHVRQHVGAQLKTGDDVATSLKKITKTLH